MALGRPSKYDPKFCKMLIEHMSEGLSIDTFCAVIDVCEDTLYEWFKVHSDFSEAKKVGVKKSQLIWERLGIRMSNGTLEKGNSTAWIFNMKNRFNWKDKQEISGNEQQPIQLKYSLDDKEDDDK